MPAAPLPANEVERLEALRETGILDTPPEMAFDDITLLAAHLTGTPTALITLVDQDRQWFKSKVGFKLQETSRDESFCAHTILRPGDLTVVQDATQDERFAENPLVLADPRIRFYAGAPLVTRDGYALGSLCVIDRVPRDLNKEQLAALRALSRSVLAELELRRYVNKVEETVLERDRARRELEQANRQLQEKNEALELFSSTAAHDLKAPLRGIEGYTRILIDDYTPRLDLEGAGYLQKILQSVLRMNALIDDLLAYSRMELRDFQAVPLPVDRLVAELLGDYQVQISRNQIEVANQVPPLTLVADPPALRQALSNLIDNAIKYSSTRSPQKIEIGGKQEGGRVIVWVKDNGIGFPMEKQGLIFQLFKRLPSEIPHAGTGIGLAVVQKAVQRMGGRVWADSSPGQGAAFYIELPEKA